ncbi:MULTISPECIES: hypothetical protein [Metallibacterium]|uniref:hypothetical protein n=1 Tax=Metallibacterium TaxID=1218803 RepID=UPI0026088A65|nr:MULTISPECIES: hypothetical protein [Metallibacterium]MBW8074001.1 hypothetical protein [Metallibacterium scheffleri]
MLLCLFGFELLELIAQHLQILLLLIKLLLLLVDQGAQRLIRAALMGGSCEHWAGRGKPEANGQGQK